LNKPLFLLQIVENDASVDYPVARFHAGGPLESDLIDQVTRAVLAKIATNEAALYEQAVGSIMAKATGFGPSANAKHESDVRAALAETMESRMAVYHKAIMDGTAEAIHNLKAQTRFNV